MLTGVMTCQPDLGSFSSSDGIYTTIRSSLDRWKASRKILADSISSYLSACTTLHAHCTAPAQQSGTNTLLKEALATVNSELESLKTEEQNLCNMRASLSAIRNHSTALSPINSLPPEILSQIFAQSRVHCARDKSKELRFHDIAAVCAYWRRVALNSADLWAHIDVGPGTPEKLTKLLLDRTVNRPIHVHVYEAESETSSTFKYETERTLRLLGPHMRRAVSLDVESYGSSRIFTSSVLNLWLSLSSQEFSTPRSLLVYRPNGEIVLSSHGRSDKSLRLFSKNAKDVLKSIARLHLQDVILDWDSCAHQGLVDLRLSFPTGDASLSILHLANMLAASSKLAILKLGNIKVTKSEDDKPCHIALPSLKVLNLVELGHDSVKLLLPLISVPYSGELELGLPACRHMHEELVGFFTRCSVSTFFYSFYREDDSLTLPPSLLPSLPSIPNMILRRFDIDSTIDAEIGHTPGSHPHPHLPNVKLVSCSVTLSGLKSLINQHGVQDLHLERCNKSGEERQDLQDIQACILESYPNIRLCISEIDSVSQASYGSIFDR
ncbi:F-box-like protein [Ceratobasidium sp. AG-Ba]|nr:F-box-like protein [Ceratobasidium sp. AG-Ba]QRW10870.1 F-box-like protein [Ceratobasidium sp. AG-Ba]